MKDIMEIMLNPVRIRIIQEIAIKQNIKNLNQKTWLANSWLPGGEINFAQKT